MELAPSGVKLSFEVTYDSPDLNVAMSIYDDSGSSPVLVQGPTAMLNWAGNSYRGNFVAGNAKSYLVLKAVYTDDTFTTFDEVHSQGTESFYAQNIGNGSPTVVIYDQIEAIIVPYGSQIIESFIDEE